MKENGALIHIVVSLFDRSDNTVTTTRLAETD